MRSIYSDSKYKDLRQGLRNNATDAERVVWSKIRMKQINGLRFLRQYGVGRYILDFYCPEIRLAIEINGGQHAKNQEYDATRTSYLNANDIKVIRFWNNDVLRNPQGVYTKLLETINDLTLPSPW